MTDTGRPREIGPHEEMAEFDRSIAFYRLLGMREAEALEAARVDLKYQRRYIVIAGG